jgi:alkylhydroperoxidase family enzyme
MTNPEDRVSSSARVPLLPDEPVDEITALVFDIFRRENRSPINLYRALANSPKILRAYAALAQGLRYEAATPRPLRELMILRTAQLAGSRYEWAHHRQMAMAAGVPEEQVEALSGWQSSGAFDERERAALRCTEEVHRRAVTDETFRELECLFGTSEAIELVLLVAFYQAVAMVIQALDLPVEPEYRRFLQ